MSENKVEVEFGANTSGIEAGAKKSEEAVKDFAAGANAAGKEAATAATVAGRGWAGLGPIFSGVRGRLEGLRPALSGLSPEVTKLSDTIRGSVAGDAVNSFGLLGQAGVSAADSIRERWDSLPPAIQGAAKAVGAALLVIGAAMIGKKFADENAEMVESTRDFARALGTATNEAAVYRAALDDVGATTGEFEGFAKGLGRQIRQNEDDLKAMGLATRDAQGNLRPLNQLTLEAIELLNTYNQGTDRVVAGQTLFGRSADASSRVLMLNKEAIEANRLAVQELGLEVGESAVKAWEEYDTAADRAGLTSKAFSKAIGESVMPVMTTLTEMFNAVAPAAIVVLRGALGGLSTAFLGLVNGVVILWETVKAMLISITEPFLAFGTALVQLMSGDFTGASQTMMAWPGKIAGAWSNAYDAMVSSSQTARDRIASIWAFATGGNAAAGASGAVAGTKGATTKDDDKDKDKAAREAKMPDSYMQYYEAVLAEDKRAQALLTDGLEFRKEQELAYWRFMLDNAQLTSKDRATITKRAADLEVAILREQAGQRRQIDSDNAAHAEKMALLEVDGQASANRLMYDLNMIDREKLLEMDTQFEQRRAEIRRQALQARLAAVDPATDPVLYNQLLLQIEQLEAEHLQRMGQLRNASVVEAASKVMEIGQSLEQGWARVFSQIGTSIRSIGQLVSAMGQVVLQTFIQMLAQMAAKWLANRLLMMAFGKVEALSGVAREAAKAGAGGVASMAAAPFPLNLTAPAFGAAMSAAAMAFAPVASAAGGYDIPAGVNPLVQAHAREMILPEKHSDVIRSLAENGGARGGDTYHMHVQAIDGASVKRILVDNPAAVAAGIKSANRNFASKS